MIGSIINLLELSEWHGVSHNIDISKGMYESCSNWNDVFKQVERVKQSKKYSNGTK